MPIVRDLKKRDSKKILILNKGGDEMPKKAVIKPLSAHKREKADYVIFRTQDMRAEKKYSFNKRVLYFIAVGTFILFVLNFFTIGVKITTIVSQVEADAYNAFNSFISGGKNAADMNLGGAIQSFESANKSFEDAKERIWFLGNQTMLNRQGFGDSVYSILESGRLLSDAALLFSQGVSEINEVPILFVHNYAKSNEAPEYKKTSLTEKLKSALELFNGSFEKIQSAQTKLNSTALMFMPVNLQNQFVVINNRLNELIGIVKKIQNQIPAALKLLGDRYPHRYLVLLQNNSESRPTGGFIGSYLIVDVNDGYIENTAFYDIYESDGQLNTHIPTPQEIAALTDNWRMRDSNYSPDFELSAKKAAWFLEQEKGPGVDTVIAVNQSIVQHLFEITGPVEVEGFDTAFTANNYNTVLTYIIESKLEGAANPKAVLERLISVLKEKLYNQASFKTLFTLIQKGISEKQILAWSSDTQVQDFFKEIGIDGKIIQTADDEDFLNLISINIGGNKSDLYIESEILHETVIDNNGEISNKLTYSRKHTWRPDVLLDWKEALEPFGFSEYPEGLQDILGRGTNKSVIKIFLPKGSIIEDVIGIDKNELQSGIDEELDKSFVYFTLEVLPQNERVVTLLYKLPYKLDLFAADEYRLTVQKQPGSLFDTRLIKRILLDPSLTAYRSYPEDAVKSESIGIEYRTTLKTDQNFAALIGRE
ncbi:DUF4012 domain-containing protein [Candidatus Peregrinibacteria bacterium]|nr:DUF4012 domain-containing protein [Candidatus Peregrinibacteria bacterium]